MKKFFTHSSDELAIYERMVVLGHAPGPCFFSHGTDPSGILFAECQRCFRRAIWSVLRPPFGTALEVACDPDAVDKTIFVRKREEEEQEREVAAKVAESDKLEAARQERDAIAQKKRNA